MLLKSFLSVMLFCSITFIAKGEVCAQDRESINHIDGIPAETYNQGQEQKAVQAAPSDTLVAITLKSGSTLQGRITQTTDTTLTVLTLENLEVKIPRALVVTIRPLKGKYVKGEFRRFDPNYSRLLFAPTGRTLRQGDGYFSDVYVFFPSIAYGVTPNFTIMGGFSVFPGVGLDEQLKYFAPKIGVQASDNVALSIGALYTDVEDIAAGIVFAVATIGKQDNSFTVGIGLGYTKEDKDYGVDDGGFEFADHPIIVFGGNIRLSNNLALVSENWLITGGDFDLGEQPFTLALRFFGDRIAADVGAIFIGEVLEEGFPVPWLSFVYNFGKK